MKCAVLLALVGCLAATAQDYENNYVPFSYYTYFPYRDFFSQRNDLVDNNYMDSSFGDQHLQPEQFYGDGFEPLNLPSGARFMLGEISSSFSCADRPYGYYADVDNFCRVYHVCNPQAFTDGTIHTYQYSFMCGEGTSFDQRTQTCERELLATPCSDAPNYYFMNSQYGLPHEKQ